MLIDSTHFYLILGNSEARRYHTRKVGQTAIVSSSPMQLPFGVAESLIVINHYEAPFRSLLKGNKFLHPHQCGSEVSLISVVLRDVTVTLFHIIAFFLIGYHYEHIEAVLEFALPQRASPFLK
jgi:hypothetical protein